jgi:toxin ParE1/3/4
VILSPSAKADLREVLEWTLEKFGLRAAKRYRALLKQALVDIAENPERPGSQERPELGQGVFVYHVRLSRKRAQSRFGPVGNPRHFAVYRSRGNRTVIEIIRILHDSRDLARHVPHDQ